MPAGSRKVAKGNRGTILQNWHQFFLHFDISNKVFDVPSSHIWNHLNQVASLFRTGAGGRNIPSNSKKAYQSFEAHCQDLLPHLFC